MRNALVLWALSAATQATIPPFPSNRPTPPAPSPDDWVARPVPATVGDTVWLERRFSLPPGWRLRPGRLEATGEVEALGEPVVTRAGAAWVVRYPVAAWAPGERVVVAPPAWRLGPNGEADSVPGGTARFVLASVIPDSVSAPEPRPAFEPLRSGRRNPSPVAVAAATALAALAGGVWWRRRPPRIVVGADAARPAAPILDARWIDAGEPKAVAARAAGWLRAALAQAVPEAHQGLSTAECLDILKRRQAAAPLAEVTAVLSGLDRVAFAPAPEADVAALARRARLLAEGLQR